MKLETLTRWLLRAVLFLLPIFFLPITGDFFDFNKLSILVVGISLTFVLWSASQLRGGVLNLRSTPLDLPFLVFAIVVLTSAVIQAPNKMDAFVFPGLASVVAAGFVLYFLFIQEARSGESREELLGSYLWGAAATALVTLLAVVGAFSFLGKFVALPAWLVQPTFSPAGGVLPAITLFLTVLPYAWSKVRGQGGWFPVLVFLLLVGGAVAAGFHALPGKATTPRLLPLSAGWSIALETLKQQPILGVGPGNFIEAFNRFRPLEFNLTDVWNLRFGASSNWALHIFTVAGLAGLVSFLWILGRAWRVFLRNGGREPYILGSLALVVLLLLLVPGNFLLLTSFFVFLAAAAANRASDIALELSAFGAQHRRTSALPVFTTLLSLLLFLAVVYFGGRVYAAEMSFRRALNAVGRNEGVPAYNNVRAAIRQNPTVDRYRITNSQINLALANSLAQRAQEGQELGEQDRNNISQLIQQSIDEAKAAVALNPRRSFNWTNLAQIYRALMAFAQGADQWAVASYRQAIALEPMNPNLRIELGGIFYALEQYEDAVRVFEVAVQAKPDLANAHFNLAITLREAGRTGQAAQEMAQTLALVNQGTPDYDLVQRELQALQARLTEEATASGQIQRGEGEQPPLQAPEPAPEPVVQPPLELPQQAAPPATESGQ